MEKLKQSKKAKVQKAGFMYYMKPANLASEIKKYGYEYTVSRTLGIYLALLIGIAGISILFRLKPAYSLAVCAAGIIIIPSVIYHTYKKMYEQQRFSDLTVYLEQMLYSFKKNPKILYALKDTLEVFPDEKSMMHQDIVKAIHIIESSFTKTFKEDGLSEIEKDYGNERLIQVHKFMLKIENLGGNYDSSIMLLLEADRQWTERTGLQMKSVAKQRRDLIMVIVLNILVCAFVLFAFPKDMTIVSYTLYQISTMLLFIASIFIYAKIDKKMGISWLSEEDESEDEDGLLKRYDRVKNYNAAEAKKKSFRYAQVPFLCLLVTILYCLFTGTLKTACLFLLAGFAGAFFVCLNQHSIGYRLDVRSVTKALEKKFPAWLMEVSLRSQSDNIHRAIMGSMESCPGILKPALKEFIADVEKNPDGMEPYHKFLYEFNVPEIHSAMKMFYSISNGNGGDADEQITELLSRNDKLMDKAEQIKNEDRLASFSSLQYIVVITGIIKLVCDLVLFFIMFFQTTSF